MGETARIHPANTRALRLAIAPPRRSPPVTRSTRPQVSVCHRRWFANARAITQSSWYPDGASYVIPPDGEMAYSYELPWKAVREAIVNAVTHRDYASNASVQAAYLTSYAAANGPSSRVSAHPEGLRAGWIGRPPRTLACRGTCIVGRGDRSDYRSSTMVPLWVPQRMWA